MANQKILVPYNFTVYDQKALDFIIHTFSHLKDVEVTLFNAYTPVPKIDTQKSTIMEKLHDNLNILSLKVKELEADLKATCQKLLQYGFLEQQVHYLFKPRKKDIAREIIDLAVKDQFTLIVLNSKPGKLSHYFTGNVYSKIVNKIKDTAVCVIT
ncbi:MAG: universal stress protein [Deltaproteobacteria bacterium]|nr:universal stress protein [Deltaproteobacteria bacterium]